MSCRALMTAYYANACDGTHTVIRFLQQLKPQFIKL